MKLVITLRREVADRDEGEAIYELVKTRLQDHPEVKVNAHVTNHFPGTEPEPPY